MADCGILFPDRLMGLVVFIDIVFPPDAETGRRAARLPHVRLDVKVIRLRSTLVDEIAGHFQIAIVARRPVHLDQGQFELFMPGISLALSFVLPENPVDAFGDPLHDFQEIFFSGRTAIGSRCLHHMACAIHLMPFQKVRPSLVLILEDEGRVKVSISLLGLPDNPDYLVRFHFEFMIRMACKTVSDCLKPLREIAVLEDITTERALFHTGGSFEIRDRVTGFRSGNRIIQGLPLVGDDACADVLLLPGPECPLDPDFAGIDGHGLLNFHSILRIAVRHCDLI